MANRDVFPTENRQWPDPTQVSGAANAARVQVDEVTQLRRDCDDWKAVAERRMQERDELMEALERALERSAPEHLLAAVERDELAQDRAALARIKAGG